MFFTVFVPFVSMSAQQLNVILENEGTNLRVNQPSTTDVAGEVSELNHVIPLQKKLSFTSTKEFYENSSLQSLVVGSDVPTFFEPIRVTENSKSNFIHTESNTLFPYQINDFERIKLTVSAEKPSKAEAVYKTKNRESTLIIRLIPSGEAVEGRLRDAYLVAIKQLSQEKGKNYLPKPNILRFRGNLYRNNGVEGTYVNDEKSFSQINVWECGTWLLITKLDFEGFDEKQFDQFSQDLTCFVNPSRLTGQKLMNLKPNVDFQRGALKDTVITGALVASAFKKIDWASENINLNERYSGFPDLYLNMHTESLQEYLRILDRKSNRTKEPENLTFYVQLKAIRDAGYLAEFIVDTYENVMIVPDNVKLNFAGYYQWKKGRVLSPNLLKKRYKINYRSLPY
ncbi:MAG: hypothetical protein ACK5KP_05890 [Paludibacteraceae bacterium]